MSTLPMRDLLADKQLKSVENRERRDGTDFMVSTGDDSAATKSSRTSENARLNNDKFRSDSLVTTAQNALKIVQVRLTPPRTPSPVKERSSVSRKFWNDQDGSEKATNQGAHIQSMITSQFIGLDTIDYVNSLSENAKIRFTSFPNDWYVDVRQVEWISPPSWVVYICQLGGKYAACSTILAQRPVRFDHAEAVAFILIKAFLDYAGPHWRTKFAKLEHAPFPKRIYVDTQDFAARLKTAWSDSGVKRDFVDVQILTTGESNNGKMKVKHAPQMGRLLLDELDKKKAKVAREKILEQWKTFRQVKAYDDERFVQFPNE